jgi:hypothetical protein
MITSAIAAAVAVLLTVFNIAAVPQKMHLKY